MIAQTADNKNRRPGETSVKKRLRNQRLPVFIPLMPVKSPDQLHILFAQFKIEDVIVLGNMVRIGGTGDGDKACLQLPPENDLRRRLTVLFSQFFDP